MRFHAEGRKISSMAHHKSTIKRIKVTARQQERNKMYKSRMKTAIKRVKEAGNKEAGNAALINAYSEIDKMTSKGIISKNAAANKKSRLTRFVNSLS